MRRRWPLLATALTALLATSASSSAAILDVRVNSAAGPALCVSTSALASSVTAIVGRPGGGALVTVASATPEATQCDGSAGRSFRPALPFDGLDGAAGATLAIADSTGDSLTVPFPVAGFETANGGFSGRLHLRNLPTAGTTQVGNGGSLPVTGVTSGAYDSAGAIATPDATVVVTSAIGGTPYRADIAPRAFAADVSSATGATTVAVRGADPGGGALAIELTAPGGGALARTTANPRIGAGLGATATLPVSAPSGSAVTVTQGTWSTRTQLASASLTADGFTVSVPPSPAGCAAQHTCLAGTYAWALQLHDPAASAGAADALGPCHALGPDVSGVAGCGAFAGARTAVTASGELPVVDDAVTVTLTDVSLGSSNLRAVAGGARGSLDDGSLHVRGAARQPLTAAISSPRGALPPLRTTRTVLTNASGVAELGPERTPFTLRVADGATVSLSGAGAGSVPLAFAYRLAAALAGPVLSGTAAPGARVLVEQSQGSRIDRQLTTASSSGAFMLTLHDPAAGDQVVITAGDPATHGATTLSLIVNGLVPRIQGIVDQQPVRAGALASVAGLPAGAGVRWGGDLPETLAGTSSNTYAEPVAAKKISIQGLGVRRCRTHADSG